MSVLAKLDLEMCVLWLSVFAGKHIYQGKIKTKLLTVSQSGKINE